MAEQQVIDGRTARRGRNMDSVIEAAIELISEGNPAPGVTEIASRAGVSYRSVFRYFPERNDVIAAALDLACDRLERAAAVTNGSLVEGRVELWETSAPVARALRLGASRSDEIARRLKTHRQFMRQQNRNAYKKQLDRIPLEDRTAAVAGIDLATSFEGYEAFRIEQRMSKLRTAVAVDRLVKRSLRK